MQTLVSRETSPLGSAVLSITRFNAGVAFNVIPDFVTFGGTLRSLTNDGMQNLMQRVATVNR